jgi:sugar lactone lactonase YvrE
MALLLAATCARAQFGVQPVGASSGNQGITVTATVAGTVSSVEVLTLGSSSGDFAVGTGSSNCASANLSVGSKCTESVTFTPAEPGLRTGAVVLVGTVSGQTTVLGTAYLSGTGQGGLGVLVAGNVLPVAGQLGLYKAVDDEQLATKAELYAPGGAVVDGAGNLYIADTGHHRIRMVCGASATPTIAGTSCAAGAGIISTIAGNGDPTYSGDDGPAVSATVNTPGDVALDGAGNLYIADSGNNVIRMINAATGVITTVAGNFNGTVCGGATDTVGDGCAATQATLNLPQGVTIDGSGNLYIADTNNHRIREVSATTGSISTIAGSGFTNTNGSGGYNGDNITAITARLNFPYAVAFDAAGNMYIPDSANHRIREVLAVSGVITASSNITTFAGTGQPAATPCTATPVAATQALVWYPSGVAVDAAGNVYIAETQNAAIRKVSADTGDISTIVQNDCGNYYVNGQFMTQVLYGPTGLYLDGKGDLYIADTLDMLIREVQGNFVAINLTAPPVFQGQTSPTQLQTVENDGNAPLDLASITVEAPPNPPEAELETAVTNSCANGQTLTENADCVVGAVFAPPASPVLTVNTQETPIIDVADESMTGTALSTSPLQIELVGTAEPLYATNTLVTSSPNPSGLGQSVTFTVTVTTGSGALTGTVSISDTFNGVTTTLATALPLTASGSTSATATFSISTLLVGLHSITATYTPGTTDIHTGSTSPAETQSVVEGTSVNLTSSANPSTVGQSVTFTATVSNSAGGVNPTGTINFYDGFNLLGSQAINASYMATFTTSALTNGMHSITAQFVPSADTQLQSSTSPVLSQDVQAAAKIAIISSLNPSTYGTPVTFTATITSAAAFPATGTVTFLDNGVSIGTGTLGGSPATATLLISSLPVGTDPITVTYAGDAYNSSGSSAALNQVVDQGQTVTTVTLATPNPGIAGTAETISATVVLTSGSAPLAGTVTFTSGTQTLGSATLTSGAASITPTLALGSYQVVATYQPSNPNAGASTSSPFPYTVVLATTQTTLVVAPNPDLVLTPITFTALVAGNGGTPTGSVNFLVNGTVVGTTALNGGKATYTDSTLLVGTYSITAQYLGDTNDSTSVSAATSETVTTIPTTTVITSGITTGANPQVILVAAVLDNGTGPVPTGTVTFYNGNTVLGSATVDSTGAATITPSLALGANYSVDAVYSGDSEHGSSTSSALSVSGTPVDFGVIVTPSTVTMASSQNATVTVTLISNANFTGTIGLGCSTLPAAVNCHFASISLNLPAGGSVSTQLTIDTNNPLSGGSSAMNRRPGDGRFSLAGLFLPLSLGFGFVFWRWRRRHAQVFTMALVLVLTAAAFVATGCGGFSQVTAAPGTYVIQVTGTNTASDVVHYQNVTLDITN